MPAPHPPQAGIDVEVNASRTAEGWRETAEPHRIIVGEGRQGDRGAGQRLALAGRVAGHEKDRLADPCLAQRQGIVALNQRESPDRVGWLEDRSDLDHAETVGVVLEDRDHRSPPGPLGDRGGVAAV